MCVGNVVCTVHTRKCEDPKSVLVCVMYSCNVDVVLVLVTHSCLTLLCPTECAFCCGKCVSVLPIFLYTRSIFVFFLFPFPSPPPHPQPPNPFLSMCFCALSKLNWGSLFFYFFHLYFSTLLVFCSLIFCTYFLLSSYCFLFICLGLVFSSF